MAPIKIRRLEPIDVLLRAIDHESAPLIFHEEETTIGFEKVFDAELDERRVLDWQIGNQELNDSILPPLRKYLEFVVGQRHGPLLLVQRRQNPPLVDFDFIL